MLKELVPEKIKRSFFQGIWSILHCEKFSFQVRGNSPLSETQGLFQEPCFWPQGLLCSSLTTYFLSDLHRELIKIELLNFHCRKFQLMSKSWLKHGAVLSITPAPHQPTCIPNFLHLNSLIKDALCSSGRVYQHGSDTQATALPGFPLHVLAPSDAAHSGSAIPVSGISSWASLRKKKVCWCVNNVWHMEVKQRLPLILSVSVLLIAFKANSYLELCHY